MRKAKPVVENLRVFIINDLKNVYFYDIIKKEIAIGFFNRVEVLF